MMRLWSVYNEGKFVLCVRGYNFYRVGSDVIGSRKHVVAIVCGRVLGSCWTG